MTDPSNLEVVVKCCGKNSPRAHGNRRRCATLNKLIYISSDRLRRSSQTLDRLHLPVFIMVLSNSTVLLKFSTPSMTVDIYRRGFRTLFPESLTQVRERLVLRLSRIALAPSLPTSFHRRSSSVNVLFALKALARQAAPCMSQRQVETALILSTVVW